MKEDLKFELYVESKKKIVQTTGKDIEKTEFVMVLKDENGHKFSLKSPSPFDGLRINDSVDVKLVFPQTTLKDAIKESRTVKTKKSKDVDKKHVRHIKEGEGDPNKVSFHGKLE